ncbi:UPF0175 family protein [Candidatus Bathyarchaeota archaeon]|nr:UPF0175 family protein [Candidatus Bathyarchaeota archaeon]
MALRTVTARLPPEVLEEIEGIAERERIDRSEIIRRLLDQALSLRRIDEAAEMYRDGKVTLWRASEMAGVSLREMMKVVDERRIVLNYTIEDLDRDIEYARQCKNSQ